MDVLLFSKQRVAFIRQLYGNAATPFEDRKAKIESGTAPFEPYYSEDGEPPYVAEWIEADESLHILAYTSVSMPAASLHLYFRTWEALCGVPAETNFKADFKAGWLNGYHAYFKVVAKTSLSEGPADLSLIEEVVLARNRVAHPESITSLLATYSKKDLRKLSNVFFIDPNREMTTELPNGERDWLVPPTFAYPKKNSKARSLKSNVSPSG